MDPVSPSIIPILSPATESEDKYADIVPRTPRHFVPCTSSLRVIFRQTDTMCTFEVGSRGNLALAGSWFYRSNSQISLEPSRQALTNPDYCRRRTTITFSEFSFSLAILTIVINSSRTAVTTVSAAPPNLFPVSKVAFPKVQSPN